MFSDRYRENCMVIQKCFDPDVQNIFILYKTT
jgi:hypothetical protein